MVKPKPKPKTNKSPSNRLLRHTPRLSKVHLLIFALIFATIGGYVLYRSFAAGNPTGPATYACSGRSFYISYTSGNDSNDGTSISSAWQNAPGMADFTSSYTPQAGDCFYFEGGVTWPNSSFPMVITGSGTSSEENYYGPDYSWYSGSSWSRPIFNAGGSPVSGSDDAFINLGYDNSSGTVLVDYITLDNFEMTGFDWNGQPSYGQCSEIDAQTASYITIDNIYAHGWSHSGSASDTNCYIVSGDSSPPYSQGSVIENSIFDGSDTTNGGDSMYAAYAWPSFENNVCNDLPNCYLGVTPTGATSLVTGNLIENCTLDYSGNHSNAIETLAGGTYIIANNVINDTVSGCETMFLGNSGESDYVWNNVMYNLNGNPPELVQNDSAGLVADFWNNTIVPESGGNCLRQGHDGYTTGTVQFINNHCITTASQAVDPTVATYATTYTANNNLLQTPSTATTDGYSAGTTYAYEPTSSGGATVGSGANLSSDCTDSLSALCSSTGYACTWVTSTETVSCPSDTSLARPSSGAWDAGAYQYSGSNPVAGDLNGDGVVNILDLSILLDDWATTNSAIETNLNNSGPVGIIDLSILLSDWGDT